MKNWLRRLDKKNSDTGDPSRGTGWKAVSPAGGTKKKIGQEEADTGEPSRGTEEDQGQTVTSYPRWDGCPTQHRRMSLDEEADIRRLWQKSGMKIKQGASPRVANR